MSMFTTAPNRVKKVSVRTKASDRSTASNKRNGKATSKCAAFDGWRKKTAKKISGTTHDNVKTKFLDCSSFRQSRSAATRIQQSKRKTAGVKAWKTIR